MSDWYGWCQPDCTADIDMTTGREPLITATKQCGNGACSSWHSNGYHDSALSTDAVVKGHADLNSGGREI